MIFDPLILMFYIIYIHYVIHTLYTVYTYNHITSMGFHGYPDIQKGNTFLSDLSGSSTTLPSFVPSAAREEVAVTSLIFRRFYHDLPSGKLT